VAAVAMTVAVAEAVAVSVEEDEADGIDDKADDADVQHPVGVLDLMFMRQPLDRFDEDREAQRNEED